MAFSEDNTINHEITGNERFRLWGAKVKEMLEATGLTRTSDTGQINWATVEWPAAETDAGYEIWRFNDSLQSSRPIYIKIFYGRGEGEKRYRVGMQVGNKTNGAGTLEEGVSTRRNVEPKATSGFAALGRLHACYSDSTFVLFGCVNPAQAGTAVANQATWFFEIGRLRDVDGTIRSSSSFADAYQSGGQGTGTGGASAGGETRNGNAWTATITYNSTGESSLVNNVASPSVVLPYSPTVGRVCGPILGRLGFSIPAQGDKGKVELYGKQREYVKAYSAQLPMILLRE